MWKMSHPLTLTICILFALLSRLSIAVNKENDENVGSVEEHKVHTLKRIYSLDDYCVSGICTGFQFDDISAVAFFDLKAEVHITDAATYDIRNPEDLDTIIFENSTFAHFPLHLFYSIGLKELDMRNCSVETITWENFLMAGNLRVLLLSSNKIQVIEEMTFNYASELQILFLDSNRISSLVNESFRGLTKLRFLDLQKNSLRVLPEGIFEYLPSLQELFLAENHLRVIGNSMFFNNLALHTITLNGNKLHELGEDAFREQSQLLLLDVSQNARLKTLVTNLHVRHLIARDCSLNRINIYGSVSNVDLRNNKISELYFSQPESLETLDLSNNTLQQIASLTRAINLRVLDLSDNADLTTLPDSWAMSALERLDLSNTSLIAIPISAIAELSNLRFLNVSQNKLREINPSNFKYLENLTHLYLHANDWNCFHLKMLMDLLIRPHGIHYTHDIEDPEFPGEYIDGIACMYRLEEVENEMLPPDAVENIDENVVRWQQLKANAEDPTLEEVAKLRNEMKAIVLFYEEKFSKAFELINDLNVRLEKFERMNETIWQYVTIVT